MDDERRPRRDDGGDCEARPQAGALRSLLQRLVAPRTPEVLVMERDGRLVSTRITGWGDRAAR